MKIEITVAPNKDRKNSEPKTTKYNKKPTNAQVHCSIDVSFVRVATIQ